MMMKRVNLKPVSAERPKLVLIGIASHESDFRVVWAINNSLKFKFVRTGNLPVRMPKYDLSAEFGRYVYEDEERYIKYSFISNRSPDGFLFPEVKNIDFIVHVNSELIEASLAASLVKSLKKIDIISGAYVLDPSKLKGIERIIL
jgi:hypothetical protein